jgi:hypothetical protein
VVYSKENSTLGCVLLAGFAELDISAVIADAVTAGIYYLSAVTPGGLTPQRPPVTVPVLIADGEGNVLVNTQITDFLHDHVHFKYDLVAAPAGEHSQPVEGDRHVITGADSSVEGWLPADDPIFGGKAPAGSKFGYNLSANANLKNTWPPVPVTSAMLEMLHVSVFTNVKGIHADFVLDFPSIPNNDFAELSVSVPGAQLIDIALVSALSGPVDDGVLQAWVSAVDTVTIRYTNTGGGGPIDPVSATYHIQVLKDEAAGTLNTSFSGFEGVPSSMVTLDQNGIWWMTDCYNEVPWPANLETGSSESVSEGEGSCPVGVEFKIRLWFNKLSFLTDQSVVTSLTTDDDRIEILCANDPTKAGQTGALLLRLALEFLLDQDNVRGNLAIKEFDATTNKFNRGPIAEGLYALSSNVNLTGESSQTLSVGGQNQTVYQGAVGVSVDVEGTQELDVQLIRLDGVTEEFFEEIPYIEFPDDELTKIRAVINIPATLALVNPKLRIRLRVLGRAAGTLPALTLTGRRLPRNETGAEALPLVDSAIVMTTTGVVAANEYREFTSDEITVVAGDQYVFTVERDDADGYTGALGILQQTGLVSAGA